jgi:hypothetical protein
MQSVTAAKNGRVPLIGCALCGYEHYGLQMGLSMRIGGREIIAVALLCFMTGVHAARAKPSHGACAALKGRFVQSCHCDPKYANRARYEARLLAGFKTDYDVEKWEKAYRQGLAHWGSPQRDGPTHGRCVSSG